MTNNKITYKGIVEGEVNRMLAKKVMGWQYHQSYVNDAGVPLGNVYTDEYGNPVMDASNWQPTQNISQALMCAWELDVDEIRIQTLKDDSTRVRLYFYGEEEFTQGIAKTTARAICSALLEAIHAPCNGQ